MFLLREMNYVILQYNSTAVSPKVGGATVDGRVDLCLARHKTANPVPYYDENQPERLEAGAL